MPRIDSDVIPNLNEKKTNNKKTNVIVSLQNEINNKIVIETVHLYALYQMNQNNSIN